MKNRFIISLFIVLSFAVFACAEETTTVLEQPVFSASVKPPVTKTIKLSSAVGIDFVVIDRLIPGLSYTKLFTPETSFSVFGGGIVDGKSIILHADINWYYLFNEYLYAGLGASASLDKEGYAIWGFANPSIGMLAEITENIKCYFEMNLMIFTYRTKSDIVQHFVTDNATPGLKMSLRYFF